jgi:hypothetical protein
MSFLTTFINPSFLLCLGIIVIVGGLLYIQTESKAREQNHKISSMLSLVSSLADEVNSIKHVLQVRSSNRLIDVSDDEPEEDSDAESDNESDSDDESDDEPDDESDDENIEIEVEEVPECLLDTINSTIKVLKLDIGTVLNNTDDEDSSTSSDDLDDLESEISFHEETTSISTYDLKTIQLANLEDTVTVIVDYKKMSVQMLKSVIKEKGFAENPSKLKKPELLKLLGV